MRKTNSNWSRWYTWPLDRAVDATPSNVKTGDWIESDLVVRPHMAHWLEQDTKGIYPPAICPSLVWLVITAEAFQLEVSANLLTTHCVLSRYRIWQGEGAPMTEETETPDILREPLAEMEAEKQEELV